MRLRIVALQTVCKECSSRSWALRTRSAYRDSAQLAHYMSSDLQFSGYSHTKDVQGLNALHADGRRHGPTHFSAAYDYHLFEFTGVKSYVVGLSPLLDTQELILHGVSHAGPNDQIRVVCKLHENVNCVPGV